MRVVPGHFTLEQLLAIHQGGQRLEIDASAWPAVQASAALVQAAAAGDAPVYGVNTGFGKLASTRISAADLATLQWNLIRSHSVGVGEPLAPAVVRLVMAMKAGRCGGLRRNYDDRLAGALPSSRKQRSIGLPAAHGLPRRASRRHR